MSRRPDVSAEPARAAEELRDLTQLRAALTGMQELRATKYLLDLARSRGYTDYALASRLRVTRQAIGRYRKGFTMSDAAGHALAVLIAIPPELALVCLNSERAKTPELRAMWRNTASLLARSLWPEGRRRRR